LKRDVCPVDTHVHRTLNRIGIVKTNTPDKTFFLINKNFPKRIAHSFHTNLIRLGREICKPSKPACNICPLFNICLFENKSELKPKKSQKSSFMLLDHV
jgi:endonuclease-3